MMPRRLEWMRGPAPEGSRARPARTTRHLLETSPNPTTASVLLRSNGHGWHVIDRSGSRLADVGHLAAGDRRVVRVLVLHWDNRDLVLDEDPKGPRPERPVYRLS